MIVDRIHIEKIVHRLLLDNTPPAEGSGPTPAPAMECVIRTKSGYQMQGVLAKHTARGEYDELKMAMVVMEPHPEYPQDPRRAKKAIAEHYFGYDDIECIILVKHMDPKLVASVERSPIIMPGS